MLDFFFQEWQRTCVIEKLPVFKGQYISTQTSLWMEVCACTFAAAWSPIIWYTSVDSHVITLPCFVKVYLCNVYTSASCHPCICVHHHWLYEFFPWVNKVYCGAVQCAVLLPLTISLFDATVWHMWILSWMCESVPNTDCWWQGLLSQAAVNGCSQNWGM